MNASPGTPLYNLPLLGEGTGQVESLTSYIVRLARAHYVRPRDLIRRVAGEGCPDIAALCYARFFSRYATTVNGLGKYARLFADRFSELTGNPNLAHATLLPWHRLLAPNGSALLAPHPRWCAQCWLEDVRTGNIPYSRLAWSVSLEKYCAQHRALLQERCALCGLTQPAIPRHANLFHCDHCHKPLTCSEIPKTPTTPRKAKIKLPVEKTIEELIGLNSAINPDTTHQQFANHLTHLVMRYSDGNRAALCTGVGLPPRALNGWLAKGQHVSLALLVHLCQATDFDLASSFVRGNVSAQRHRHPTPDPRVQNRKYHSVKTRGLARKLLADAIADNTTARSLAEIATTLGVSRSYLRYWHPQLVDQVVENRRSIVRERAAIRAQYHQDVIRVAIRQALGLGMWPGRKWIESIAREGGFSLLNTGMLCAYQNLLRQMAIMNTILRSERYLGLSSPVYFGTGMHNFNAHLGPTRSEKPQRYRS